MDKDTKALLIFYTFIAGAGITLMAFKPEPPNAVLAFIGIIPFTWAGREIMEAPNG